MNSRLIAGFSIKAGHSPAAEEGTGAAVSRGHRRLKSHVSGFIFANCFCCRDCLETESATIRAAENWLCVKRDIEYDEYWHRKLIVFPASPINSAFTQHHLDQRMPAWSLGFISLQKRPPGASFPGCKGWSVGPDRVRTRCCLQS